MISSTLGAARDIIIRATDKDYPPIVHLPHSIISVARYRQWRLAEGEPIQWLYDLVISFFSHSQGGGAGCKAMLEGKNLMSYLARWDYTHFHVVAYLASYFSPGDVVYRWMMKPRHPARLFCVVFDAMDGVTTACAMVDKVVAAHPHNRFLPAMMGIILYNTGSVIRWLDARCRGKPAKTFLAEPGPGVARGATVAMLYLYLGRVLRGGKMRNKVLVTLSWLEILLEVIEDMYDFDTFEVLAGPFGRLLAALRSRQLSLGCGDASGGKKASPNGASTSSPAAQEAARKAA